MSRSVQQKTGSASTSEDPKDADKVILLDGIDYKGHAIKAKRAVCIVRKIVGYMQLQNIRHCSPL